MNLEPDILEWEVKWALGSITTRKAPNDKLGQSDGAEGQGMRGNSW